MIKTISKFLFFCASGAICAVFIFEIALRFIEYTPAWKSLPIAEVALYGPDRNSGYTHRPNVSGVWATENRARVSTTPFGIRSNEDGDSIAGDKHFKIGLIGDSITEAIQVSDNETFSALLEQEFHQNGQNIRVYNLGLAGATPAVEAARAKHFAERLNLDLIIILEDPNSLALTLAKAGGGALPYYKEHHDGSIGIERPYINSSGYKLKTSKIGATLFFMLDHSKALSVLNNRLNRGLLAELNNPFAQTTKNSASPNRAECNTGSLEILATLNSAPAQSTAKLFNAFLHDLSSIKHDHGTAIILALYDTWGDCPKELEVQSRTSIQALAKNNKIPFFDLKQALLSDTSQNIPLKNLRGFDTRIGGGHLNHTGHKTFSRILKNYINRKNLIK